MGTNRHQTPDFVNLLIVEQGSESYTSTGLTVNESRRYEEDLEWLVPQFGGSSFAEFSPVDDAFSLLTLKMKFRSFDGEGLLFFISQTLQDGDFVSLSVGEGQVEFRFDTGSGPLILKSSFQVSDGKWHNLVARRNRREGMLTVDDQPSIYGTSPAGSIGLDVRSNIFVGGFPSELEDRIGEHVGIGKGLTGCIKEAQVQDRDLPMSSIDDINRISVYRLAPCQPSPCFPNLCGNSSNCFISKETNSYMNKCECAKGFGGSLCGEKVESCAELNCDPPSACGVDPTTKKHICTCAPGMMDPLCKNKTNAAASLPTFMPGFAQDSYLIRPSMGSVVKSSMQVTFVFYSSQPEGLIFYNAQKKSGNGDYVAVYLLGHHLVFQYDLGSGPALIRSSRTILLNEWHEVVISQRMGMGEMSVDGRSPDRGESPRGHTKLNLKQPLYLAGTPRNVNPPPALSTGIGLTGALQKFQVNGLNFDLSPGDSMSHYNVRPFNAHPCYHTPCLNGGSCHPHLGSYTCVCTDAWRGEHCEDN